MNCSRKTHTTREFYIFFCISQDKHIRKYRFSEEKRMYCRKKAYKSAGNKKYSCTVPQRGINHLFQHEGMAYEDEQNKHHQRNRRNHLSVGRDVAPIACGRSPQDAVGGCEESRAFLTPRNVQRRKGLGACPGLCIRPFYPTF
jgi:hypothetical protein